MYLPGTGLAFGCPVLLKARFLAGSSPCVPTGFYWNVCACRQLRVLYLWWRLPSMASYCPIGTTMASWLVLPYRTKWEVAKVFAQWFQWWRVAFLLAVQLAVLNGLSASKLYAPLSCFFLRCERHRLALNFLLSCRVHCTAVVAHAGFAQWSFPFFPGRGRVSRLA